jgi:hypothetical protein
MRAHDTFLPLAALVLALASAPFARGETWFNAGIGGYTAWPADGVNKVVPGAGVWSGTAGAVLTGGQDARRLDMSTPESLPLEFIPIEPRSAAAGEVAVSFDIQMSVGEELSEVDQTMKGALTALMRGNGEMCYLGLVKDPAGATNVWVELSGAVPDPSRTVGVKIVLRTVDGMRQVKYSVDGVALRSGSGEWTPIVFSDGSESVVAAGCLGTGGLEGLQAGSSREAEYVTLVVPPMELMTPVSVTANGETVAPQADGTYLVQKGAYAAVTFVPLPGVFLDNPTMVFKVDGTMTLPEEGLPAVVPPGEVLSINEVMASNEASLRTARGGTGLDWIEIRNRSDSDVDITGWYLSDNPDKNPSKWAKIQGRCVVPANGYAVVWADQGYIDFAENEAYTRIGLSSDGETVFLATPLAEMVHSVTFGQQIKDVSVGAGRRTDALVSSGSGAEWRIGVGEWMRASGPVGAAGDGVGFTVTAIAPDGKSTVGVRDVVTADCGVTGAGSALKAEGAIHVPRAGRWTFYCGGAGTSSLTISNREMEWTLEHPQLTMTLDFPGAGDYDVSLVCTARDGAAAPELLVGEGELDCEEDAASFSPLCSSASGFTHAGRYAPWIAENIADQLDGATSFDWRAVFSVEAPPAPSDDIRLRVKYADGFTARLNGVVVASVHAEGPRAKAEALEWAEFNLPASAFVAGENTLLVTAESSSGADMMLSAELLWSKAGGDMVYYFPKSTPGAANGLDAKEGPTPRVAFSEPHGYKTASFSLELTCPDDPGATIYYTTDGTAPSTGKIRYTGPISISRTTVVRAAVPNADSILQLDTSATYLFPLDIVEQRGTPSGFPEDSATSQKMTYGMNQTIVGTYRHNIMDGFTNGIDTLSLVIDPANLFNASTGIYVNASNGGRSWERMTMVELITPTNSAGGFSVPSGVRIRGAYSRGSAYPKHSLRLFFRNEYGMSKLKYPLFDQEGVDSFDKIDLRTAQNYSWANGNNKFTFIEEVFSRDSQRDLDQSHHRSRYYHLFINGTYWGVYQTEERTDGNFGESYFGGTADDYDVVRTSQPGYVTGIVEGQDAGWYDFWNISVNQGYGAAYPANYNKVRGLNPDGTPNPAYPVYLNPTNVAAFMLTVHFSNDTDCPAAGGNDKANNMAALRNRHDGTNTLGGVSFKGWAFHRHDAEHSLGTNGKSASADLLTLGSEGYGSNAAKMKEFKNFNPSELHYKLEENAEYRMLAADLLFRSCLKEDGAMTAAAAADRFRARMRQLGNAISCEAARWGGGSHTPATWTNACNSCLSFINARVPYLVNQYRARGWYPSVDAPRAVNALARYVYDGASMDRGDRLFLVSSSAGTIYYTIDGTDPRLEGGAVSSAARVYSGGSPMVTYVNVVEKDDVWNCYDWGNAPSNDASGRSWNDSAYAADAQWRIQNALLGFGSRTGFNVVGSLYKYTGHASSGTQTSAFYFRKSFTMPEGAPSTTQLKLSVCYDDGYVMYINGVEVDRVNIADGETYYGMFTSSTTNPAWTERTISVPEGLLRAGENVVAVELHQCHGTSSDAYWGLQMAYPVPASSSGGLEMPAEGMRLRARLRSDSGEWSALESVDVLDVAPPADDPLTRGLRVAEVMSCSADLSGDGAEFIVLTNLLPGVTLDLEGVRITCTKTGNAAPSLDLALAAGVSISPGASIVLTKAELWPDAKITNGKMDLVMMDAAGSVLQTVHVETSWFDAACDETGASFIALGFGTVVTEEAQWAPSFVPPDDATGAKGVRRAIAEDDAVRLWMNAIWRTQEGKAAITAFAGDGNALRSCYLVGALPETEPEIEVSIPSIEMDAAGRVTVGGRLTLHGVEVAREVNGRVRLYHAPSLEALKGATEFVPLKSVFPAKAGPLERSGGASRFYQLRVE